MLRPLQPVFQALLSLNCVSWGTVLHIKQEGVLDLALDWLCLPGQVIQPFQGPDCGSAQVSMATTFLPIPLLPGATPEEGTP